jgi:Cupredoxin-like domain
MRNSISTLLLGIAVMSVTAASDVKAQTASYSVAISSVGYQPAQLTIAASAQNQITITNISSQSVELEGKPLVGLVGLNPGASAVISLGPVVAGTYAIIDDLHPALGPLVLIVQ